jgi:hypothetical protein
VGFVFCAITNSGEKQKYWDSAAGLIMDDEFLAACVDLQRQMRLCLTSKKDSYMRESQFAQFLGRCRLYQFLPVDQKKKLPQMLMTDTQIGLVAKAYYNDDNFSTLLDSREISMWNVYNLLTGANKSSYIDNFLDRSLNATQLAEGLNKALYGENEYSWFIN